MMVRGRCQVRRGSRARLIGDVTLKSAAWVFAMLIASRVLAHDPAAQEVAGNLAPPAWGAFGTFLIYSAHAIYRREVTARSDGGFGQFLQQHASHEDKQIEMTMQTLQQVVRLLEQMVLKQDQLATVLAQRQDLFGDIEGKLNTLVSDMAVLKERTK